MFGKKRKSDTHKSDGQLVSEALADLAHDQKRKKKRRKGKRLHLPAWLDRRVLIGCAVAAVVVIGEGVRRENMEFYAVISAMQGQVGVRPVKGRPAVPAFFEQKLQDRNVLLTGPQSWVELSFADGSVILVDADSEVEVRLMEYSRGGRWRARSFYLTAGAVYAAVGRHFGKDSTFRVYTPSSVAGVRGTRFSVTVTAGGRETQAMCADGAVAIEGFTGRPVQIAGGRATSAARGSAARAPRTLSSGEVRPLQHHALNRFLPDEPWHQRALMTLTQVLDAPLTILGIGKCSWGVGAADYARRSAALEALRKIHLTIEGYPSYPPWVDPATLEQLDIRDPEIVGKILKNFDGGAIERYMPMQQGFIMWARARDKQRTRYELTQNGVRLAANQD